jgi:hypothetical protein
MSGIILDRSEFVVLMDAVDADEIVGLNTDAMVPTDETQLKAMLDKGLDLLQKRGALRVVDDVNILNVDLLSMAVLVANPEVAVITTRDNPGLGQQLFLHYAAGDVIVEQTLPSAEQHRWALVPGQAALAERVVGILPVQAEAGPSSFSFRIEQDDFLKAKQFIETGQRAEGLKIFQSQGLTSDQADQLAAIIAKPTFGGSVAVLQCRHGEIVDARNLAVAQGEQAAIFMKQAQPGETLLEVTTCQESTVRSLVANWLAELSNRQN